MGFLVPAFLAGLAALAVPLWMHLRDRDEESPTRFPSLMFLVRLPIRSADRRRITDWPLLLLRALAVALLVLAFARPYVGSVGSAVAGDRTRAVVVALDRSLSMSHGETWAAARDSVRAVIDALSSGDHVSLLLFDTEAEVAQGWTTDHGALRASVDAMEPVARGTRFGVALRAARGLLVAAPPAAREVVLVSDLQRSGLQGSAGLDWPEDVPLRAVVVGDARRANTSIVAVEAKRVVADSRATLQVQARILSRESDAPRTLRATLALNGREVASREITLPENGERLLVFDPVPAPSGGVQGVVSLTADALPGDDRFFFTVAAEDDLRMLLLLPEALQRDETLYLERAMAIGRAPGVRVERRGVGTLDAAALERAQLVMLWDVAPPAGDAGDRLLAWVQGGGGVVQYVGPRLAARRGALLAAATPAGLADRSGSGGGVIGEYRADHPLFQPFRATPAALGAPRLWRYARIEPAAGSEVLARLDDGAPMLLERREGEGRILVTTLPLDATAGDLPLQPAFLPLIRRLALHVSGHEAMPVARATGEAWMPRGLRREPVIAKPDGVLQRPDDAAATLSVVLDQPGIFAAYEGRVEGTPRAIVAANVPAQESDLTRADPRELLLGVGSALEAGDGASASARARELETTQGAWRILILIALLLLLAESWLGSRGWRGRARRASIERMGGTAA